MRSLSGSDLLKYASLPSCLAFLPICIFLSSCNSFGISSNILKFVPLSLRPHLNTRSLSEYLKKRAMIVRLPFPLPLLGFPILLVYTLEFDAFRVLYTKSVFNKINKTFSRVFSRSTLLGWGFKRFRYPFCFWYICFLLFALSRISINNFQ